MYDNEVQCQGRNDNNNKNYDIAEAVRGNYHKYLNFILLSVILADTALSLK